MGLPAIRVMAFVIVATLVLMAPPSMADGAVLSPRVQQSAAAKDGPPRWLRTGAGPDRANDRWLEPPLAQLVQQSGHIVAGEVLDTRASRAGGHTEIFEIFTTVALRVDHRIKGGAVGSVVRFRIPGGAVGDVHLEVTDTPSFEIGETVVVFLRDGSAPMLTVVGGKAGKRPIRQETDGTWHFAPPLPLDPRLGHGDAALTTGDLSAVLPRLEAEEPSQ